jgi:copper oxidase (laccase) domain-containing protein
MSVGPHAQSCCYEVKEDVSKYLYKYIDIREGKEYLDMSQSLKELSNETGFQIEVSTICTICDSSYNSYRENKTNKRQYGFIWI